MKALAQRENVNPMITAAEIAERIEQMGQEITQHYQTLEGELVMVGILKGSFIFLSDLCRKIALPLTVEFIGVSSYGDATESSGVVQITQDLTKPVEGKHLLLVEDIVDTGLTMKYLLNNFSTRGPASVKVASLLEKPSKNTAAIPIDFLGFSIPDKFVIGYGLDLAGAFRNLPFVGVKEESA
jgi:hypoxanthine phosphoribosyltransferase